MCNTIIIWQKSGYFKKMLARHILMTIQQCFPNSTAYIESFLNVYILRTIKTYYLAAERCKPKYGTILKLNRPSR